MNPTEENRPLSEWASDLLSVAPDLRPILKQYLRSLDFRTADELLADLAPWAEAEFSRYPDSRQLWATLSAIESDLDSGSALITKKSAAAFVAGLTSTGDVIRLLPPALDSVARLAFPLEFETFGLPLTADERSVLRNGLFQWGGPTNGDDAMARFLGFTGFDDLLHHSGPFIVSQIEASEPLIARDWARALLSTETIFAGNQYGVASDWQIVTGIPVQETFVLLQSIQRKMLDNDELMRAFRSLRHRVWTRDRVLLPMSMPLSRIASDWWLVDGILSKNGSADRLSDESSRRRAYLGDLRHADKRVAAALEDPILRDGVIAALLNEAPAEVDLVGHFRLIDLIKGSISVEAWRERHDALVGPIRSAETKSILEFIVTSSWSDLWNRRTTGD